MAELRSTKHWQDDQIQVLERENAAYTEQLRDTDLLMSALSAMQEKNSHLENSLSAENRVKLDLFSALGEAKRQLELRDSKLYCSDRYRSINTNLVSEIIMFQIQIPIRLFFVIRDRELSILETF